jgi:hypothetical protein
MNLVRSHDTCEGRMENEKYDLEDYNTDAGEVNLK